MVKFKRFLLIKVAELAYIVIKSVSSQIGIRVVLLILLYMILYSLI